MRWIDLDASGWTGALDFYDALLPALGAPDWHGRGVDALNESMIWGGINAVEPPYTVRITATGAVPDEVICEVKQVKHWTVSRFQFHAEIFAVTESFRSHEISRRQMRVSDVRSSFHVFQ